MASSSSPAPMFAPGAAGSVPGPPPRTATAGIVPWTAVPIAAWGVALIGGGVAHGEAAWAPAALGAGLVAVLAAVLTFLARRPGTGLAIATGGTAAGLLAAGWLAGDAVAAIAGATGLVVLGAAGLVTAAVARLLDVAAGTAGGGLGAARAADGGTVRLHADVEDMLRRIDEHAMLSDNARRVLFRERELALLGQAIEEDIRDGRYDVALTLADEMADVFGERDRAEQYREQVLRERSHRHEATVRTELGELDRLLSHRQWRTAQEVADRLRRTQPDPELAADIDRRFLAARARHKQDLEAAFLACVERGDTEEAMRVLRELDHYLTAEEAGRFRELAGGVIKQHRENLGLQFKLAVNDHRWQEAVTIGETIIVEFPNTKMAGEVRSMIDLLRRRADGEPVAAGDAGGGEHAPPPGPPAPEANAGEVRP